MAPRLEPEAMMLVGVPKETKDNEYRVSVIPATAEELVRRGHRVIVEAGAGSGAGLTDAAYEAAGAEIVTSAEEVFDRVELIVKVKEPLAAERKKLKRGQVLFTYLHLAADLKQAEDLVASGVTAIAYETVTGPNAALIAIGFGADVIMAGENMDQLRQAGARFGPRLRTVFSTRASVETLCRRADLVIGAVLVPGAAAPKLVSAETVKAMKPGAVIVDVSIDQGGMAETSRPTTHSHPTYIVDEVVHYCVTNMPGALARTSTFALSNVTAPYVLTIADKGHARALSEHPYLRDGLNVHDGEVTHKAVAEALDLPYVPASEALKA
jgi:alanine dehydrogenase